MRLKTSFVLASLLMSVMVLLAGHVLSQSIFAEPLRTELHVTPMQYYGGGGFGGGGGYCPDGYGGFYPC
ncbi:MAG: hypothetical protein WAL24_04645 [Nitrososphaeraceae archaeon]